MRAAVILGVLLTCAAPAFAQDFTQVVKDALASAEPTTAVLRGCSKLPDFSLDGDAVRAALAAAGAKADGQVAQVLGDVVRLTKKKDRITIERSTERLIPIVVAGQTKGWVKLEKHLEFRIRSQGDAVALDKFDGLQVGKTQNKLYDLWNLGWKPGAPESTLTLTAGWGIFSETNTFKIPNTVAAPTPAPVPPAADPGLPPPAVPATTTTTHEPPATQPTETSSPTTSTTTVSSTTASTAETPGIIAKVAKD